MAKAHEMSFNRLTDRNHEVLNDRRERLSMEHHRGQSFGLVQARKGVLKIALRIVMSSGLDFNGNLTEGAKLHVRRK
jgi:hypothetical protein